MTKRRLLAAASLLLLTFGGGASASVNEPLDPAFGAGGIVRAQPGANGAFYALSRDRQGRLLAAGTTSFDETIVMRFLGDGSLDPSFGKEGVSWTSFEADAHVDAIAVQDDGKIVVAGAQHFGGSEASFILARYLPDGTLDRNFGKRGRVVAGPNMYGGEARALALQSDGKILAAGYAADTSFGYTGILMRFKPNGELDESFSRNGFARISGGWPYGAELEDVAVLPNGRILVAGNMFGRFMMLRMLPDGRSDPSFGDGDGFAISDVALHPHCKCASASNLAVLADGRILLSGKTEEKGRTVVALARYRRDGSPDRNFGQSGVVRASSGRYLTMEDMAVRRDGRIVLAGYRWPKGARPETAVLRYLPGGRPDRGFAPNGLFTQQVGYESEVAAAIVEPNGEVTLAGRAAPGKAPVREINGEPGSSSVLDRGEFLLMRLLR